MNYGEMLAKSIVDNDGSTYAQNASKSLEGALESYKSEYEMKKNMIDNTLLANQLLMNSIGTKSTTTKDKDGNVTTIPGTGWLGLIESEKDFAGRSFDLTNAINENTAEYKNQTFNAVLEAQKEEYELMANDNSVKNLELSIDTEINKTLAQNNSSLNIGKVKAYLTNPNLINEAVKSGELTDADAVMLRNMQQQGISDAVAKSNKLRLMKEYTDNGWLTEENLFRLAKIRSEDPFAKLAGLSTIDIYAKLAEEQRVARNQGKMTNDMFDLNYSVNKNLLDGNRAINNGQYGNNQANGNSNVATNSSARTTQANMNASVNNSNVDNQQQVDNIDTPEDDAAQYISNLRFDNGKTQIDFTDEGNYLREKHRKDFEEFADQEFYKPGQKTNTIWEGTKGAISEVASHPAFWLLLGGGTIGYGVKYFGGFAMRNAPKLLGLAKNASVATLEWVLSDMLAADGKEAMESVEKMGKDIQKLQEERNSKLSKTKDERARYKIKQEYKAKMKKLYDNSPIYGNKEARKWISDNGYSDKIQKAFKNNDTKELERLAKEVSNNKEFQKIARTNAGAKRTKKQGIKTYAGRTAKSALYSKIGLASIVLSALPTGAGVAYDLFSSDDEHKNNNTYDKFTEGIDELNQFNPDKTDRRMWENIQEDTKSHFITNYGITTSPGQMGTNVHTFLKSFDYEQIRQNINNDYKNGKISQKESSERLKRINQAQKAAEAVKFQDNILHYADKMNKDSRYNALNNPITESPDDLENSIESRNRYKAQLAHIPTTINKQLDGGNPHQKNNQNISPSSGLLFSSQFNYNVTEVNFKGVQFPVDAKVSENDKVSYDFLKMKDAPEGTIIPLSAAIIKDKIVSTLNNNDLGTAKTYNALKDKGFDDLLVLFDRQIQSGPNGQVDAYQTLQKILTMLADTVGENMPGGLVTVEGSSRVKNKEIAQALNGKKVFISGDSFNNQLMNDVRAAYKLQEVMQEASPEDIDKFFNPFVVANIFGNSQKINKVLDNYEQYKKRKERNKQNNKQ